MKFILTFLSVILFSSFDNEIQENRFVFKDQNQTIILELESKQKFLAYNHPTEIKVSVENIDLKQSSIIGKGICLTGQQGKNYFVISITADEENVFNNSYTISFNYTTPGKVKKFKNHKFIIPVKK